MSNSGIGPGCVIYDSKESFASQGNVSFQCETESVVT